MADFFLGKVLCLMIITNIFYSLFKDRMPIFIV